MKLIEGLLDYSKPWTLPNIYLFTGNSVLKTVGAIVMGRGAAKQVRDAYPGIDIKLGKAIRSLPYSNVVYVEIDIDQWIGWFQVKHHWSDPADLRLIHGSAHELTVTALRAPDKTFHLNYPGVGNGKLSVETVRPFLDVMPDNVLVYR